MNSTKIEWTDLVWNPVTGCSKVSAGCKHCYAETIAKRFWGKRKFTEVRCHPERLDRPKKWSDKKVFVNSMSDLFHEDVPMDFLKKVFDVMTETPQNIYQILTKRPDRMADFMKRYWDNGNCHRAINNIWLGTSIENQEMVEKKIPQMLESPAALHFVSLEPLLGRIDIYKYLFPISCHIHHYDGFEPSCKNCLSPIDWVIVGGESGFNARECRVSWIVNIVRQCSMANVPVFVKQLGAWPVFKKEIGSTFGTEKRYQYIHGKYLGIKDKKGANIEEWPPELRIREFPE